MDANLDLLEDCQLEEEEHFSIGVTNEKVIEEGNEQRSETEKFERIPHLENHAQSWEDLNI